MRFLIGRCIVVCVLLFLPAPASFAQAPAADPSGHWEGAVAIPDNAVTIEMDITKNAAGAFAGTFGQPAQNVRGLPLSSVTVDGRAVRIVLKAGVEASTFSATLSEDGKTLSGEVVQGGHALPFTMTRIGDAKFTPAPRSAAIAKEFEGTWNGALDVGGRQMRLILKVANQPDGTATGSIASPDGSGIEIAIGMTQKDKNLTVDVPSINASFAGVLGAEGTELTGAWTQAGSSLPLTLKKAPK